MKTSITCVLIFLLYLPLYAQQERIAILEVVPRNTDPARDTEVPQPAATPEPADTHEIIRPFLTPSPTPVSEPVETPGPSPYQHPPGPQRFRRSIEGGVGLVLPQGEVGRVLLSDWEFSSRILYNRPISTGSLNLGLEVNLRQHQTSNLHNIFFYSYTLTATEVLINMGYTLTSGELISLNAFIKPGLLFSKVEYFQKDYKDGFYAGDDGINPLVVPELTAGLTILSRLTINAGVGLNIIFYQDLIELDITPVLRAGFKF